MSEPAPELPLLLGPMPEVPPSWLETHATAVAASVVLAGVLGWLAWRLLRRRAGAEDPALPCRRELIAARAEAGAAAQAARASRALRAYLAAVCPEALPGLSTEELAARCERSPLLATAADPAIRALREADRSKFAGDAADGNLVVALADESLARVELARRALWKEARQ